MVKDLAVDDAGTVTFTFLLARDDPGSLAREVRKAVQAVEGVTAVRVNVTDASSGASGTAPRQAGSRPGAAAVPPPPTPVELPHEALPTLERFKELRERAGNGLDRESARTLVRELKAVGGDLKALRLALTGRERGPELAAVLQALPKDEALRRIDAAL